MLFRSTGGGSGCSAFDYDLKTIVVDPFSDFDWVSTSNQEIKKEYKDNILHLYFQLSGVPKENVDIKISGDNLDISVKKTETVFGVIEKNIKYKLSVGFDKKKISSNLKDGILTIILPTLTEETTKINID